MIRGNIVYLFEHDLNDSYKKATNAKNVISTSFKKEVNDIIKRSDEAIYIDPDGNSKVIKSQYRNDYK